MKSIGETLKKARIKSGYSQKQAAKKIGITDSRLSKMERDLNPCPPREIKELALLYNTPVIDLYISAGYLTVSDLDEYQMVFHGVENLDEKERSHIQEGINLLIRRKDRL
ncbi:helix-turn-helix domain-containing protein [Holdemanella porci]|uniref:helix-turn-helix domain-containing protein n=1 Tax=Holdemanella porci TaxID=2652276 RepID=UPI003AB15F32